MGGRGASSSLRSKRVTNRTVVAYEFKQPKGKPPVRLYHLVGQKKDNFYITFDRVTARKGIGDLGREHSGLKEAIKRGTQAFGAPKKITIGHIGKELNKEYADLRKWRKEMFPTGRDGWR